MRTTEANDGGEPLPTAASTILVVSLLAGLYLLCIVAPWFAVGFLSTWQAIVFAIGAIVLWGSLGPAPMPSLIPGILAMTVLVNSAAAAIASLVVMWIGSN